MTLSHNLNFDFLIFCTSTQLGMCFLTTKLFQKHNFKKKRILNKNVLTKLKIL